jgi:NCS2 family nucleobase:cation symporter-2
MTLDEVNAIDQSAFVAALGEVFEHSPWIAATAWAQRPFASLDALHSAMVAALFDAPEDQQLALIRAHPELASKAALRGDSSVDSRSEQAAAGLTRCSPEEFARLQELNTAYNRKFGFPFIIAVHGLHRRAIIERFAKRLERNRDLEFGEALAQAARIARLRLERLLGTPDAASGVKAPPADSGDAIDARLPVASMAAIGVQHVLVMYAGAIAVPLIVGGALRMPKDQVAFLVNADLFACGLATLIQCIGLGGHIGIRLPVVMGASFAASGPLLAMVASGATLTGIFGAVIAAGAFTLVVAPFAARLLRYFPPLVTGIVITVIGITLLRVGINWAGGGAGAKNFGDPANLAVVALVLVTILVINKLFTGLVASIAVLLGLGMGFVVALALGMVDFSGLREADWVALVYPFRFGLPTFDFGAIVSLCVVMLVVMVESTGMFLALGDICERRIAPRDIARGLAADGLGTIIGGAFNSFPFTPFAQNVGLVGVTGVRSRWVVAVAGGMLMGVGLLPKLGMLVASIPQPVLGGAGLVMFGVVAATGIKVLARSDYAARHNLLIIAVSIALGMIPLVAPTFFAHVPKALGPLLNSGITLSAISAVLLNIWFNGHPRDAAAPG